MTDSAPAQKPRGRRDHIRLCVCMCVCLCLSTQSHFTRIWLRAILWTVARQAPLSMGFPRQEYWSGLPRPPAGNLPDPGIESASLMPPALAGRFFTTSATWEAHILLCISLNSAQWGTRGKARTPFIHPPPHLLSISALHCGGVDISPLFPSSFVCYPSNWACQRGPCFAVQRRESLTNSSKVLHRGADSNSARGEMLGLLCWSSG